jgi:hypothetical protein
MHSSGGPCVINDVSPDRIPVSAADQRPRTSSEPATAGNPLDKLQSVLGDADATGSSSE